MTSHSPKPDPNADHISDLLNPAYHAAGVVQTGAGEYEVEPMVPTRGNAEASRRLAESNLNHAGYDVEVKGTDPLIWIVTEAKSE